MVKSEVEVREEKPLKPVVDYKENLYKMVIILCSTIIVTAVGDILRSFF